MKGTKPLRLLALTGGALALAVGAAACGELDDNSSSASAGDCKAKIALLLPESKTTRYEAHDHPEFEAA